MLFGECYSALLIRKRAALGLAPQLSLVSARLGSSCNWNFWAMQRAIGLCKLARVGFEIFQLVLSLVCDLIASTGQLIRWRDIASDAGKARR